MTARAQGLTWGPLAQTHFPNKTGNACRKRHERLMEKKDNLDNDGRFEEIARMYLEIRKEMWEMLANRVGQRWQTVEAKVRFPTLLLLS